jgi:DNA invertase Pin-like site-specific DNA recombinase
MSYAWIYCRVSKKEQAADGTSLPTQWRYCQDYCDRHQLLMGTASNYNNPGVFADPGISAWKVPIFERPGFQKLWSHVQPGDSIAVMTLDRAFRSVNDFSNTWMKFDRNEVTPIFVRENINMGTAMGKMIGHMTATFAQFRSDLMSERTREALAFKRETGQPMGCPSRPAKMTASENSVIAELCAKYRNEQDSGVLLPGRVFGYIRVSTANQKLGAQANIVNGYLDHINQQEGIAVGGTFEDHGVSAFRTSWCERPGGKKLFAAMRPGDTVVVSRIDRVFRSIVDMSKTIRFLTESGIHLVTTCGIDTRTEQGRQCVEILAVMAEWESRTNSFKVKEARKHSRKLRGKWERISEVPRYLTPVTLGNNQWSVHPNMTWLDQARTVRSIREDGNTWDKVSDIMESHLAAIQNRPMIPRYGVDRTFFLRQLKKRGQHTEEQIESLTDWFDGQKPRRDGEFIREWSPSACKAELQHIPFVEDLISETA